MRIKLKFADTVNVKRFGKETVSTEFLVVTR